MGRKRKNVIVTDDIDPSYVAEFIKAAKIMGEKNARELINMETSDLKNRIAMNHVHISEATQQTKENSSYIKASETKADFDRALRENNQPFVKASALAASVLRSRKAHQ